jgi:transposase-like protein
VINITAVLNFFLNLSCSGAGTNKFEAAWGKKYRYVIESWRINWDALTSYFNFPLKIHKIIFTTYTIENLNRGIHQSQEVQFTDDLAAQKAAYLAIMNREKNGVCPSKNWGYILHQFLTIFENRCKL